MGDVYLARQESLDRLVAVKLLPPDLAKDQSYVVHFLEEARSAAKVTHENIVGAYDCGEANGRYYFVMEYVAGETLFKQIHKQGRLPERRALEIARQIARGLRHALQHGLIHRDIKPKNILITAEGTAKICDFGLARDLRASESAAEEEFLHTTPAYASPEQCRGEANLDHRTDLYSLGVTLFEMLTGKRPFQADTSRQLMSKQVSEPAPSPRALNPEISEGASQLVLRMLRKQPSERFKDYDEFLAAVEKILGAGSARKKAVLLGAAAAGVIALVLSIILLAGKKETPRPPVETAKAPAPDPQIQKLLEEAAAFQKKAEGKPSEYAAVTAKWKDLETRYRGTPHAALFAARRLDFDDHVAKEAESLANDLLTEAAFALSNGRALDALRALRRFPPELSRTEAGSRVAEKVLEAQRAVDDRFRTGMQSVSAALSDGQFDPARRLLDALKGSVTLEGSGSLRPEFDQQIELMRARIGEEAAMAKKKTETPQPAAPAPAVTPAPAPTPKDPAPTPAPADPPARTGKKRPKGTLPSADVGAQLAILSHSTDRTDATKRSQAATFFALAASKSPFFRATAFFLSRDEKEWKLAGPVAKGLEEYFAAPELLEAETMSAEQEGEMLALLSQKIAACGDAPTEALQFFACAHLEGVIAKKGKPDPQTLQQARLAKAPASDLWGLPASVPRIEMAHFLVHAPGLWLARAVEASSAATDFPTRLLHTLCFVKDTTFDAAQASERWKKLGAGAPDAAWTKLCDALSDRFKQAGVCDICLGQGRFPCAACNAQGASLCQTCKGAGKVFDPAEGGQVTCTACKGKRAAICVTCNGTKSLKCSACDAKKLRPVPGGGYRWLIDLGLCESCGGEGNLFKSAAWPCPSCDGNGRTLDRFLKAYGKLPAWIKTREGRSLFIALRWLARHQGPDGHWGASTWTETCKEPGCVASPAGAVDIGTTSLALLAFVSAGLGPESDLELGNVAAGGVIRRALGWLIAQQQPDGTLMHDPGKRGSPRPVFEHLLATYTLFTAVGAISPSESFTDKDRQALREAALKGLRAALALQGRLGWGSAPQGFGDCWDTSWGAAVLLAARDAGVDVPRTHFTSIVQFFDTVTDKKDYHLGFSFQQPGKFNLQGNDTFVNHDTLSAFGGLMRMQIEGKASNTVAAADRLLGADLPNPDPLRRDFCYWYLGTVFQVQREQRKGTGWTQWSQAVAREALSLQLAADTCSLGSWAADDRWSLMGGKVYVTAINALTTEQILGLVPAKAPKSK
jgi:serine/threonine-protein kinase